MHLQKRSAALAYVGGRNQTGLLADRTHLLSAQREHHLPARPAHQAADASTQKSAERPTLCSTAAHLCSLDAYTSGSVSFNVSLAHVHHLVVDR